MWGRGRGSFAAGPEAVACLERILAAQLRLVELQEAQVRLLERERFTPAPPPPPLGEQGPRAAVELPAAEPASRPFAPPAGPATADAGGQEETGEAWETASGQGPYAELAEELREGTACAEISHRIQHSGAWEPEISHRNLVQSASELPEGLPTALQRLLVVLGVLSPRSIRAGWRRAVYRVYWAFVPFSVAVATILDASRIYVSCVLLGRDMQTADAMQAVFGLCVRLLVILPSIFVWRHQLSPRGATLALVCRMGEQHFPWQDLNYGVRVAWCLLVTSVALISRFLWRNNVEPLLDAGLAVGSASSANLFLSIVSLILGVPVHFVGLGSHYLVPFAAKLHEHDLLCYAGAMTKAVEGDGVAGDAVPILKKVELLVTARLRYASKTWVRFMVCEIFFGGTWALIAGVYVMTGSDDTIYWLGMLVMLSALIVILLTPMAAVAETFEYDVLRALNNPSMLRESQKYFGQQLLSHLNTLEWGFRVGGAVICPKMVSQIAVALLVGVVTTAGNVVQSKLGDAVF